MNVSSHSNCKWGIAVMGLLWLRALIFLYSDFEKCIFKLVKHFWLTIFCNYFWNLCQSNLRCLSEWKSGSSAVFGLSAVLDSWRSYKFYRLLFNKSTPNSGNLLIFLLFDIYFSTVSLTSRIM